MGNQNASAARFFCWIHLRRQQQCPPFRHGFVLFSSAGPLSANAAVEQAAAAAAARHCCKYEYLLHVLNMHF